MFKWNPFVIGGNCPGEVRYVSFGRQKSKSSPARVSMWNKGQRQIFESLWPQIKSGLEGPVPQYPKPMYVPRTPEEEAYFQRIPGLATELGEIRARMGRPAYEPTPETTEEFYQQSIRAPALKEWGEVVEPMIREAYAGPGYWSSARAEAQRKAAQDLAMDLASRRAELAYFDELSRRQALESAAAREAMYAHPYAISEAEMLGSAGQYARMIDQEKVLADLQRWLMGEEVEGVVPAMYNPFIQLAFQILGLDPYALGTRTKASGWDFGILWSPSSGTTGQTG